MNRFDLDTTTVAMVKDRLPSMQIASMGEEPSPTLSELKPGKDNLWF